MTVLTPARVSNRWISLFALAWVGIWMAQLAPFQLSLPEQINDWLGLGSELRQDNWQESVTTFGTISGMSALCALITFPMAGALSDRTTSRFGRRRPWILGGVLAFAVGLILLGLQDTYWGLAFCWCLALTGFSAASSALTAMISDQVPVDQRGVVSSWVSAPQAIGTIIGIAVLSVLALGFFAGYAVLAVLLILLVAPFLYFVDDAAVPQHDRARLTGRQLLSELWISPREHPDFGWTLLGRILVNIGNALGTSLLFFYLQFGLEVSDPEVSLLALTAVYMVFVIGASVMSGVLSDRIGRRKPFVLISGVLQGVAAVIIAVVPSLSTTLIAAALLGAGFGSFLAVDQALATQVLPDADHYGKDLGIMNIAMAVPQALGPLLGAWIVQATAGFTGLFVASAIFGVLGGLSVLQVRSVR
jgi:MFS family permease